MMTETPMLRFTEADCDRAAREWGLNCGPAALAACLGMTPEEVRPHLGAFRGFMTPTEMLNAIESAGFTVRPTDPELYLPDHGIVRVQWGGPWLHPGVPAKAAYRFTHWIAFKRSGEVGASPLWVYDINAGWVRLGEWEESVKPRILARIPRADGSFSFTHRWEVRQAPGTPRTPQETPPGPATTPGPSGRPRPSPPWLGPSSAMANGDDEF